MIHPVWKWLLPGLFVALACATAPAPVTPHTPRTSPPPTSPAAPPPLRLPTVARPTQYAVELTLVPTSDRFEGVVDVDIEVREPTEVLWLNASELTVKQATFTLAGRSRPARVVPGGDHFIGFALDEALPAGPVHLRVAYQGRISEQDTQGVFRQKEGGEWYAFTHFEPTNARRAFPCFDEPSFKVPWQLTLRVRKGDAAFFNTPSESEREAQDGMKVVRFARTRPLPSYLVAFAVGPLEVVDAGRAGANRVPVRIIVPKGQRDNVGFAAQVTGEILERLEEYFGTPHPYEKVDLIAIPQTSSFGAMENPGLITYNQRILVWRKEERTLHRERMLGLTIVHELAHQWFGNLVTMAWWDDLWLKEAFASWMENMLVERWRPDWDALIWRVGYRGHAMSNDSLVSARRIRQPIESHGDVVNAFDAITYQKGASILEMFERYMGQETFRRGVRRYLGKHAFGNATAADFLDALSAEVGRDMAPAFATFLDQPGVPLVTASLSCEEGRTPRLRLSQRRYVPIGSKGDVRQLWHIPVCARYGSGRTDGRACTLLTGAEGSLELPGPSCPTWVLPNSGASGYYRLKLDGQLLSRLLGSGAPTLTEPERVGLLSDVQALVASGDLSAGEALALIPEVITDHRHVINATLRIVRSVEAHLVSAEQRARYARFIRDVYGARARALGLTARKDEPDDARLLRPGLVSLVALQGGDEQLVAEAKALTGRWLADRQAVSPEMVDVVLQVAAYHGDAALHARLYAAARASQDLDERQHLLHGLSAFRGAAQLRANIEAVATGEIDSREAAVLLFGAEDDQSRDHIYQALKARYDRLASRLPREALPGLPYVAAGFCDAAHRADAEAFFRERTAKEPGGERSLAQALEQIDLCIALKARQAESVGRFLQGYSARPSAAVPAPARR